MLHELIWNIDFVRGLIFFALTVLAAVWLIPWAIERLRRKREKQLTKTLLKEWGAYCRSAITFMMPHNIQRLQIKEDGSIAESSDGVTVDAIINQVWQDIQEGKRKPDGSAMIINNALEQVLYSDEERKSKGLPPEKRYLFPQSSQAVPRSWLSRILNPMYAKIEIFDVELLPIGELEMAMSYLDSFSQQGHFTRHLFMSYTLHLAQSMEKFAKYLWKLENWSNGARNKG